MSVFTKNGKALLHDGKALNLDSLIALANATTGEDDKTLAAAVDRLIEGYGQGSGISVFEGSFTPVENSRRYSIDVSQLQGMRIIGYEYYCDDLFENPIVTNPGHVVGGMSLKTDKMDLRWEMTRQTNDNGLNINSSASLGTFWYDDHVVVGPSSRDLLAGYTYGYKIYYV